MTIQNQKSFTAPALALCLGLTLTACSGPNEKVQVKTCKQLATTLSETTAEVKWQPHKEKLREPEYAVITVQSQGSPSLTVSCYYEHEGEETAETHANPLRAYESVPYTMTLNGREITPPELYAAMKTLRIQAGKRLVQQAKEWTEQVRQRSGVGQ